MVKIPRYLIIPLFIISTVLLDLPVEANAYTHSLNVGYTNQITYLDSDVRGRHHGLAFEYLETIGDYMGARLIYSEDTLEGNIERLERGDIDMFPYREQDLRLDSSPVPPDLPPSLHVIPLGLGVGSLIVRESDYELREEIFRSITEIEAVNPLYRYELRKKHKPDNQPLNLTAEERAYLDSKGTIYVMASARQRPYTWFDNGVHKGIVADILAEMSADLGVEFRAVAMRNQTVMMEQLSKGTIDMLADFNADHNWADSKNAIISFPYLTLDYVAVMRRDQVLPDRPRVACAKDHFYTTQFVEPMYEPDQLIYYGSIIDCLAAVNAGEADITFIKAITAQNELYEGNYYNLYTSGNVVFSHDVAVALSVDADPILLRIINKEIAHIGQAKIASIVNRNTFHSNSEDTIAGLVYRNPVQFAALVSAILIFIILMLFSYILMRHRHNREIYRRAYTDPLTGFYNLHWFAQNLPDEANKYIELRREGRLFVFTITAERFLFIKESYDRDILFGSIIKAIGGLRERNRWLLADAFSIDALTLYVHAYCPEGLTAEQTIERLMQEASVIPINGVPTAFSFICGICMIPAEGEFYAQDIMDNAKAAQASALRLGKHVAVYDAPLHETLVLQQQLEDNMYQALMNEEFRVYYQPKYNLEEQSICAAEALVRWDSPKFGFLMPGKFIELFEKNGFAINLDYYMLEHVCQYQKDRLERGLMVVPISVNQSGLHITEENYLARMQAIADKYGLPSGLIELELTETAFIDYTTKGERENATYIISSLRKMGFSLSMDDFCTGYSSIAMLENLPMDVMKVDRSMLLAAEKSDRSLTILRHVVEMGHSLNMKVLTEGVETRAQELLLLSVGCTLGQGYLFAKPMPEADFSDFIESH